MSTDAGTVHSLVSVDVSTIVTAAVGRLVRVTVNAPVPAGSPSVNEVGLTEMPAVSSS